MKEYENIENEKMKSKPSTIKAIKGYLDALMDLQHFLKPLYVQLTKKDEKQAEAYEKDTGFYSDFDRLYKVIRQVIPLYNQTRNYLTKKPYNMEKYKLNFKNQTLADGWDKNKETDNTCVILKKDRQYFLGIINKENKEHRKLFNGHLPSDGKCYQKMEYKLLPGANKMLPKVFFSKKNIQDYAPLEEILKIRNHSTHTKNGDPQAKFKKKDYHKLLEKREEERDLARKSWKTIEKIKDLKEGYLSWVVHKISKLMIKHNAIVVFEDLNLNRLFFGLMKFQLMIFFDLMKFQPMIFFDLRGYK